MLSQNRTKSNAAEPGLQTRKQQQQLLSAEVDQRASFFPLPKNPKGSALKRQQGLVSEKAIIVAMATQVMQQVQLVNVLETIQAVREKMMNNVPGVDDLDVVQHTKVVQVSEDVFR